MALAWSLLFAPNQLDNAAPETLFTVPTTPATSLLRNGRVRFVNTTAGAVTVTAWAVPLAGTAGDTNCCLPVVSIAAESYTDVDIPIMNAGAFFQAQAGAATSITAVLLDGFIQT